MKIRTNHGDKNIVGQRIALLRKQRNMKQKELLAQMQLRGIDISASTLSELEGQRRMITDRELRALADIFQVTMEELF